MKIRVLAVVLLLSIVFLSAAFLTKSFWLNKHTTIPEQTSEDYFENKQYSEPEKTHKNTTQEYLHTDYDLEAQKDLVILYIESGNFETAEEATETLINNFPKHPDLAGALHSFTEKYEYASRFEEAKHVYQQIIQKCPNSSYALRAKLGILREEVMYLIESQDYVGAEKAIDRMVADFSGHPDLPDTLYWIAERYRWSEKYDEAKNLYQKIMQDYPDSTYSVNAKQGFKREEVLAAVLSPNYSRVNENFDELISEFPKDPDLSKRLYLAASSLQQQGEYEQAIAMADIAIDTGINNTAPYPTDHNYYLKGVCHCELGNYKEALKWYDKLLKELPDSSIINETKLQQGRVLYFQGKYQDAVDAFKTVLYNNPTEALAKEAQQNIEDIERVFLKKQ